MFGALTGTGAGARPVMLRPSEQPVTFADAFSKSTRDLETDGAVLLDEFEGDLGEVSLLLAGVDDSRRRASFARRCWEIGAAEALRGE